MSNNINMPPRYNTMSFTEVWDSAADFKTDFLASPFAGCISSTEATTPTVTHDNVSITYYLLYARFGNSHLANLDINQFKFKVFSIIYSFGPSWEKKLEIQEKLRKLSETDLLTGSKSIFNSAQNPSTAPSTSALEELTYINGQNTTNLKKSKMDAYTQLWDLIETDVTTEYINRFEKCFLTFVGPQHPTLYITDAESEEEEEE